MNRLGDRQKTQLQQTGWTTVYLPIYIPYLLQDLETMGLSIFDVKLELAGGLVRLMTTDWKERV